MNFTQVIELIGITSAINLLCIGLGFVFGKPWLDKYFTKKPPALPAPGGSTSHP